MENLTVILKYFKLIPSRKYYCEELAYIYLPLTHRKWFIEEQENR